MRLSPFLFALLLATSLAAQSTLIEQGRQALLREDSDAAAFLFGQAIDESPSSAEAHYWLGVAYGRQARTANVFRQLRLATRTRQEFERAVQLNPNEIRARYALVQFYTLAPPFLGGGDPKAFREAQEIEQRDPATGHEARAFIYADEKRYRQAFAELEASVKLDPTGMPAWFEIGHLAAMTGTNMIRGEEALEKYLTYTPRADEDDPPLARAFYWLGVIEERRGDRAGARQRFAASLRLDPAQKDTQTAMQRLR